MTDRVYPSAKPSVNPAQTMNGSATNNPPFPATKAQLYGATRPAYRPQPHHRRRRRSCCCSCCLWVTLFIVFLVLLAAIACAIFWVLYSPRRPDFDVAAIRFSKFNITSPTHIDAQLNLTVTARNPNKKLEFYYNPIAVSVKAGDVDVGSGTFPAFAHGTKNVTTLRSTISSSGQELDRASTTTLKSDLKNKKGLALKIQLDTKIKLKVGALKTKKVAVRISCDGIRATVPTGKSAPAPAATSHAKCKVDLRIKIWKWTF